MSTSAALAMPVVEPVIVRAARADETPMVRLQWLRSYQHSSFGAMMRRDVFMRAWGRVVDLLIARSQVVCLCPADSPEATVYGWMCFEPEYRGDGDTAAVPVLHYVHVRGPQRRAGYATTLLGQLPAAYYASHCTPEFRRLLTHWDEDRAAASGRCFGVDCGTMLTRKPVSTGWSYRCERRPTAGHPPCGIQFERASNFEAPAHPVVTVDLTRV